ncbi:hypothetical protein BASA81_012505 [Batrachochytrium salamandrivorans]|nr:hypothetical protein BASA81_012505 [Batrachochytrium salamandrivorans]
MRRFSASGGRWLATRTLPLPQTNQERNKTMREKSVPIDSVLSKSGFFDSRHERLEDNKKSRKEIVRGFWEAHKVSMQCRDEDPHLFFLSMGNVHMFRFMREMQREGKLQELFDEATVRHHEGWLKSDLVNTAQHKQKMREVRALALEVVRAEKNKIAQAQEQMRNAGPAVPKPPQSRRDTPEEVAAKKAKMRQDLLTRIKAELAA